jgi:hypothetical protein
MASHIRRRSDGLNLGRRFNAGVEFRVFAPYRETGLLIQAAVLAKAQRRKGHKGESSTIVGLNSQRP